MSRQPLVVLICLFTQLLVCCDTYADELTYPPTLPKAIPIATESANEFITPTGPLSSDVMIAHTAPRVEFAYYPQQTYPGNPWSVWGDSLAVNGKYYSAIGDHRAPQGNAFLFEYDPETKRFRTLVDLKKLLKLPDGHYVPGKIHSRIDLGNDGWLYFATHRG